MNYKELSELSAEAYLDPKNFITDYDKTLDDYAKEQYEKGLNTGKEFALISIGASSVWSASMNGRGSLLSSYEGIGYHSCTADLLRGFLDSPAKVVVYRAWNLDGVVIKEASKHALL
jgi:hypothetical protein